jgi:hypothetical protein
MPIRSVETSQPSQRESDVDSKSVVAAGEGSGGIAGKLEERLSAFVFDLMRGHDSKAQQAANTNAEAFMLELAKRLERESEVAGVDLDKALADPDVATTIRTAVIGAARTASAEKHDALARAIAERLKAAAESNEALASTIAVEAIPRLSGAHLRFLALATVTYIVRPMPTEFLNRSEGATHSFYSSWLKKSLSPLHLQVGLDELQVTHLASVGCLTYERKLRRDLSRVLTPPDLDLFDPRSGVPFAVASDIEEFLFLDPIGKDLQELWNVGLQHVTLTPAGTLIGTAVHESVGGDPVEIAWSKNVVPEDHIENDVVWDGRDISMDFLDALDRAIQDRAERGVRPWNRLDRR